MRMGDNAADEGTRWLNITSWHFGMDASGRSLKFCKCCGISYPPIQEGRRARRPPIECVARPYLVRTLMKTGASRFILDTRIGRNRRCKSQAGKSMSRSSILLL